jgi:hypothetical protein
MVAEWALLPARLPENGSLYRHMYPLSISSSMVKKRSLLQD